MSGLTGESNAMNKAPGICEGNPLEAENLAFFNSRAISGSCVGLVYCTGKGTIWGQVSHLGGTIPSANN